MRGRKRGQTDHWVLCAPRRGSAWISYWPLRHSMTIQSSTNIDAPLPSLHMSFRVPPLQATVLF